MRPSPRRWRQAVGADGILLMPPHHWLRFGRTSETAVGFFQDVAAGADIDIIVHQYPAWTKAGYSLAEMLRWSRSTASSASRWARARCPVGLTTTAISKRRRPNVSIISCLDEYLLVTLLDGADGALVGFAGFVPELITALVRAGPQRRPGRSQSHPAPGAPLSQIVYRFGEPSSDAHQRMKCAMTLLGKFPSMRMRRPIRPLPPEEVERIAGELTGGRFPGPRACAG